MYLRSLRAGILLALIFCSTVFPQNLLQRNKKTTEMTSQFNTLDDSPVLVPFNYQGKEALDLDFLVYNSVTDGYRAHDLSVFNSIQYYGLQFLMAETEGLICLLTSALVVYAVHVGNDWDMSETGYYVVSASYTYGVVDGVYRVGEKANRYGSFWWTLTSALIGTGVGLMVENAYDESDEEFNDDKSISVLTLFLPTIGAIASYNITSHMNDLNSVVSIDGGNVGLSMNAFNYSHDEKRGNTVIVNVFSWRF